MKKEIIKKYYILIPILILLIISIFTMYHGTNLGNKQLIFCILSILLIFIVQKINIKWLINNSFYFYLLNIFLLIAVLIFGRSINGAKAWLDFHYFKLQPSELMKITLMLYLIKLNNQNKNIIYLIIATIIPSVLTYLEPDTGAIIIYLIILLSCLMYSKITKKTLLILILVALILISTILIIYFNYQDFFIKIFGTSIFYRIDRLISFKTQNNIQIENALISIGAHNYIYFPEYHNDFIFAYILSNFNILITIIIIICYFLIFRYLLKFKNPIYTSTLLVTSFQVFQNILMNIGLLPIIGIPLPFLSYGGSYLISFSILYGIIINIYSKDNNYMDIHHNMAQVDMD